MGLMRRFTCGGALLLLCVRRCYAQCNTAPVVAIDFDAPTVSLEMLDAQGVATDTPFPGGSVRFTNVGVANGTSFDLYVVETPGSLYTYTPPPSTAIAIAARSSGFACLGVGIAASTCSNGGTLPDGFSPSLNPCVGEESSLVTDGAQFTFTFVESGTTTEFDVAQGESSVQLTFYDIDGETESSGLVM